MQTFAIILIALGVLIALVGGLMQLVAAFREHVLWGLGSMFVPFVSLVFVVVHWSKAKAGFLTGLLGAAIAVGGIAASPALREGIATAQSVADAQKNGQTPDAVTKERLKKLFGSKEGGKVEAAAPDTSDPKALIEELRAKIAQREAQFATAAVEEKRQYQQLTERQKALKPQDAEGQAAFKTDLAAYLVRNNQQRGAQQQIVALRQELDILLEQTGRNTAPPSR